MNNENEKWISGDALSQDQQREALARYIHRYTKEHVPNWAKDRGYHVQFASDADWLAHTQFMVTRDGKLDNRAQYCMSTPTWPDGDPLKTPLEPRSEDAEIRELAACKEYRVTLDGREFVCRHYPELDRFMVFRRGDEAHHLVSAATQERVIELVKRMHTIMEKNR